MHLNDTDVNYIRPLCSQLSYRSEAITLSNSTNQKSCYSSKIENLCTVLGLHAKRSNWSEANIFLKLTNQKF